MREETSPLDEEEHQAMAISEADQVCGERLPQESQASRTNAALHLSHRRSPRSFPTTRDEDGHVGSHTPTPGAHAMPGRAYGALVRATPVNEEDLEAQFQKRLSIVVASEVVVEKGRSKKHILKSQRTPSLWNLFKYPIFPFRLEG
jgi:hypothetical protein